MDEEINKEDKIIKFFMESDTESSSTSSSDEDSSSDSDAGVRQVRNRIQAFVEETVALYSDEEFHSHFRVSRATAEYIENNLQNSGFLPDHLYGRAKISTRKACLLSLWYLANQETFRQVADRFNLSLSSVYRTVKRVTEYLVSVSPEYIKWPTGPRIPVIVEAFKQKKNIDDVLGAIDGCHIEIKAPRQDAEVYINRKGYHSVILQGTVDSQYQFIDVYCGEPGSLHDARVLRKSPLYARATEDRDMFNNKFIIGDSAYPQLPWLLPPHKDNGYLTENEKAFNYRHSATRIVVENTFGLLKGRFRRLQKFDNNNIELIVQCIVSACVLHNISIQKGDILDYEEI